MFNRERVGLRKTVIEEELVCTRGVDVGAIEYALPVLVLIEALVQEVPHVHAGGRTSKANDRCDPKHRVLMTGVIFAGVAKKRDEIPRGRIAETHDGRILCLVTELINGVISEGVREADICRTRCARRTIRTAGERPLAARNQFTLRDIGTGRSG
jgi:hypothetical protein